MSTDSLDVLQVLQRAAGGNQETVGELLEQYRERLRQLVQLRMDRRVRARVDASDVIQETFLEAARRISEYLDHPSVAFFVWLRFLAVQRLAMLHRHHLGIQARDASREVSLYHGALPEATSAILAAQIVGHLTSPSHAAVRAEMKVRIQEALDRLDPIDREVLALRHFEQLSNIEAAQVLGIKPTAACNRYVRALERLKQVLSGMSGGLADWWK